MLLALRLFGLFCLGLIADMTLWLHSMHSQADLSIPVPHSTIRHMSSTMNLLKEEIGACTNDEDRCQRLVEEAGGWLLSSS